LNQAYEQPHEASQFEYADGILSLITKVAMSSLLFVKHHSETSTHDSRDEIGAEWYDEQGRSHDSACKREKASPGFREDRSQPVPKLWNW
jgi:hypothetical protein